MKVLFTLILCCSIFGFSADFSPTRPNPTDIRVVPVQPTPEPDNVKTTITFPKPGQFVSNPVNLQFRLIGYPVGTNSDFDRKNEIYNDPKGQSVIIFIDDYPPFEIYKSFIDSLDQNNLYYDWVLTDQVPYQLGEGMHVIRAFPDRSYGESLKRPGSFASTIFYIGSQTPKLDVNLNGPYLTYNEPLEYLRYSEKKPILLDFYLSNVQLSRDGYKIGVTFDGNVRRVLTRWVPYYIYGLARGRHTVRLQLLDEKNQVVPGLFNDVERTITVD